MNPTESAVSAASAVSAQAAQAPVQTIFGPVDIVAPIVLALAVLLFILVVVLLMRGPMNSLLKSNVFMAPAAKFYVRSFVVVITLGALSTLAGSTFAGPKPEDVGHLMSWVWVVEGAMKPM